MSDPSRPGDPPDDPWARWRKPEASDAPAAVDAPEKPKTLGVRKPPPADPAAKPARARRDDRPATGVKSHPAGSKSDSRPRPVAGESPWARQAPAARRDEPRREGRSEPRRATYEKSAEAPRQPPPARTNPAEGVRLSKVMSERGLCSRREADLWIERGWVFVDGQQVAELGTRIDPGAAITVSPEAKKEQAKAVTILLHKPVGYVSGQPEPGSTPAVTLIVPEAQLKQPGDPEFKPWMLRGLAPAGRLDVDSTGLLVLTSDGRVAKKLIGEDSEAEKEYLVRVSGTMVPRGLELLRHGLELDGKPLKPAWVKQLNEDQLHFILKEGKKRQIRRMCELVGLQVTGLKRVRIGHVKLGELPSGKWRFLRADESF
jgi:23S rRNA pseudouridine2604 synthase